MPKCPHCKKEINSLAFDGVAPFALSGWVEAIKTDKKCDLDFEYDEELLSDPDQIDFENAKFDNFTCPECDEVIATSEDEAHAFLCSDKFPNPDAITDIREGWWFPK